MKSNGKGNKAITFRWVGTIISIVALIVIVPIAWAQFTGPIDYSIPGQSLAQPGGVLDRLYGLDNIERVPDFAVETTDQYWYITDSYATAKMVTKLGQDAHRFGFFAGLGRSEFQVLFGTGDDICSVGEQELEKWLRTINISAVFTKRETGDVFQLALELRQSQDYIWSSAQAENLLMANGEPGDGSDHVVTYKIIANHDRPHNVIGNYVVAWEDGSSDGRLGSYDGNFTDVIVEIGGAEPKAIDFNSDTICYNSVTGPGVALVNVGGGFADSSGVGSYPGGWNNPAVNGGGGTGGGSGSGGSSGGYSNKDPELVPASELVDDDTPANDSPQDPTEPSEQVIDPTIVPEVSTVVLLGAGGLRLIYARRKRRKRTHNA